MTPIVAVWWPLGGFRTKKPPHLYSSRPTRPPWMYLCFAPLKVIFVEIGGRWKFMSGNGRSMSLKSFPVLLLLFVCVFHSHTTTVPSSRTRACSVLALIQMFSRSAVSVLAYSIIFTRPKRTSTTNKEDQLEERICCRAPWSILEREPQMEGISVWLWVCKTLVVELSRV